MQRYKPKLSWRRLDNTAKVFSLDDNNNTNTFRYSVILKENIDENILKEAVEQALSYYPAFKVKIGTGLFWNYLEYNSKEILVSRENEIPCEHINFKKNNDYLFKVTFYRKKINLDVFHVLTDGTGALKFFKAIIYSYLDLKYKVCTHDYKDATPYIDQALNNYDKNLNEKVSLSGAYMIPGRINRKINNTYHYILSIKELKKVCKKYNTTITEFLVAVYIYSLYLAIHNKKSKKEIIVAVPINLRNYYQVDTLANFFVCMYINPKIVGNRLISFDKLITVVQEEFREKLTEDKVKNYLARDVKLGTNISLRIVPLFIKKLFMKYVGTLVGKSATSTLSNVGKVEIQEDYKQYIDNILVLVMPGTIQKIKCTICSFEDKLNVTLNSNIKDKVFQNTFYDLLGSHLKKIKIETNTKKVF